MKVDTPDISVVIPAYRAEAFLARAIQSVVEQVGVNPEIIVVVDGVYDRTPEIAATFPMTRVLVNEANQGAPEARNRGLAAATAPFVQFLDADDFLEGPLLSGLLSASIQEELDVAFGRVVVQSVDGRRWELNGPRSADPMGIIREWLDFRYVPPCAILWRTSTVRKIGGWKEELAKNQDGELVWRGLLAGAKSGYGCLGAGVYVQHHGPRITGGRNARMMQSEMQVLDWLVRELTLSGRLDDLMRRALVGHLYHFMCRSLWWGHEAIALEFEERWRRLGGYRHQGTLLHRLVSNLIGLQRKQRLSRHVASSKLMARAMRDRLMPTGQRG